MTRIERFLVCALLLWLPAVTACRRAQDTEPPVATPAVSFSRTKAPLGSPTEITYKFTVAANAPALPDCRVMVHFLDADEELMWTDDHLPPVPTTQWKPGQVIEYKRTLFVPIYPYIGEAAVQVGLYSTKDGHRLPLSGTTEGQRAYKVGSLQLLPQTENIFLVFKEGWNSPEVAPDNTAVQWQWTKKIATIAFRNPRRDSVFYLEADNPGTVFKEPQTVTLQVNGQPFDTFQITPGRDVIRRSAITAAQFGAAEMAEVRVAVDKTFVPALMPSSTNRDNRELGIRVLHAFVEPR